MSGPTQRPRTRVDVSSSASRRPFTPITASELAHHYLLYVSSLWRGDTAGLEFGVWLEQFRTNDMPPYPSDGPVLRSPHGAGGQGIEWYEANGAVLGYLQDGGGYIIPVTATLPGRRVGYT